MPDPGEQHLLLSDWLVLCVVCEKPVHGFAVAGLFSRDGSLGQAWQVSKPAVYAAMQRLERLGLVQMAGEQRTSQGPARSLVEATRAGQMAARRWLRKPVMHGRNVRSELMMKLALLDRAGAIPGTCSGNSAPSSVPSRRHWRTRWTRPPESSTRWHCGGTRRCPRPCSSWTRRRVRPNWRLRLDDDGSRHRRGTRRRFMWQRLQPT
jgi:DNA-binding PadR family transcriptional regulator